MIDIAVKRDGTKLEFNDLHMPVEDFNGTKVTRIDFKVRRVDKTVWTVISNTFTETYAYVRMIYSSSSVPPTLRRLSGQPKLKRRSYSRRPW